MSNKDALDIIAELGALEILLKKNGVVSKRILKIDDANEISLLIDNIKSNKGIRIHSRSRRHFIISDLSKYKEFLECKNLNRKTEERNTHINKSDFYLWLIEEKVSLHLQEEVMIQQLIGVILSVLNIILVQVEFMVRNR